MKRVLKRTCLILFLLVLVTSLSVCVYSLQSSVCPVAAYEGELVRLSPAAYDPDPEIGPAGKLLWEFGPPFDQYGQWQTLKGQRGVFDFWLSVSDGELVDKRYSCVELFPNNNDPVLQEIGEIFVTRGDSMRIPVSCTDPDGDPVEITYEFDGKDVYYVVYEPPGIYDLEIVCSDGFGGVDSQRTKLHILMPAEPEEQKASEYVQSEKQSAPEIIELVSPLSDSSDSIDLVLPSAEKDSGTIDVRYLDECPPCPGESGEDVRLVFSDPGDKIVIGGQTRTFVIDSDISDDESKESSGCAGDISRKKQISSVIARCC